MVATERTKAEDPLFPIRIALPIVAAVLIVARSAWPTVITVDAITLGLVVLGCLPWLLAVIESAKLPGGLEIKVARLEQKVEDQRELVHTLVRYAMSDTIYKHLWYISECTHYEYVPGVAFSREMYFLRDAGYIEPTRGGFLDFSTDPAAGRYNLAVTAKPTPIGEILVNLRGMSPAARADMESGMDINWKPGKKEKYVGAK